MRKIFFYTSFFILAFCRQGMAQEIKKFVGTWEGKLNVGVELRVVFHIKDSSNGSLTTTADSPDQSAYGMPCNSTSVKENEITIEMEKLNASYTGKLVNDSTIEGIFTQGADVGLILKKVEKPLVIKKPNRPQTPQPPFQYNIDEVEYDNADKTVHLGATLTYPRGRGPFPVAILITGSGQQDRDETIFGHKPFAVIADHLTKNGFAVLRVDDRGTGKSTGEVMSATSEDFAKDVMTSIDYLRTRKEIDATKMGLIGHSEGGIIAPMVAVQKKDIAFIILLAAPGEKVLDLMTEQNGAYLRSTGITDEASQQYMLLYKNILTAVSNYNDSVSQKRAAAEKLNAWCSATNENVMKELGLYEKEDREKYLAAMIPALNSPWFRYFINFDPAFYLQKLSCKVLALNGSKDIQVVSKSNLPGIEAALKKSKARIYEVKELPGLNHLFQPCEKCTVNEYSELEETFSPEALKVIADWLNKNVK